MRANRGGATVMRMKDHIKTNRSLATQAQSNEEREHYLGLAEGYEKYLAKVVKRGWN